MGREKRKGKAKRMKGKRGKGRKERGGEGKWTCPAV